MGSWTALRPRICGGAGFGLSLSLLFFFFFFPDFGVFCPSSLDSSAGFERSSGSGSLLLLLLRRGDDVAVVTRLWPLGEGEDGLALALPLPLPLAEGGDGDGGRRGFGRPSWIPAVGLRDRDLLPPFVPRFAFELGADAIGGDGDDDRGGIGDTAVFVFVFVFIAEFTSSLGDRADSESE